MNNYQTIIAAFIGALSPFLLWLITDFIKEKRNYYNNLYFLERILVDQINNINDTQRVIKDFIKKQLNPLLDNIEKNLLNDFSIDYTSFPLFSNTPITEQIHNINTKSVYIDNKIARSYQLSKDLPYIIEDLRKQLQNTIQLNRDLALNKINPPEIQKKSYTNNIKEYKKVLKRDLLEKNLPTLLKTFVQTREAVNELRKIKLYKWKIKFELRLHFFINKNNYIKAKKEIFNNTEKFFEKNVNDLIQKISENKDIS